MLLLISLIDVVLSKGKRRVGAGKESFFYDALHPKLTSIQL